jgi:single-stranded-DNA-specific exonuclease
MKNAGILPENLNSFSLGFAIGPRLNASGRLEDNRPAYELLVAADSISAGQLAIQIESANRERQELVKDIQAQAEKVIWEQNNREDRFLVVASPDWPPGVLGLVAGKLAAQYNRPVAVLSVSADGYSGSARSIDAYSLIDGLDSVAEHLTRFGGHKQAAGLATTAKKFPKFVDAIKKQASRSLSESDLRPRLTIDAELKPNEINLATAYKIASLAPFGHANPSPVFLLQSAKVLDSRRIGSTGDHVKLVAQVSGKPLDLIGFGMANDFFDLRPSEIDLAGSLDINQWNGRESLQLKIKDFRSGGTGTDETIPLPNPQSG